MTELDIFQQAHETVVKMVLKTPEHPAGSEQIPNGGLCICGASMLEICTKPLEGTSVAQAWYSATLKKYLPDQKEVTVEFAKETWPRKNFPWNQVRLAPPRPEKFTPSIGDGVEVFQAASSDTPPCWVKGKVTEVFMFLG